MLGGRTKTDQEEQSLKEAKRKEKHATEETERVAEDQARRKANLAREQVLAVGQEVRELKAKKQSQE